jgi:hypothetical protein
MDLLRSGRIDEGMERLYYALSLSQETHNLEIEMRCLYALALSEIERGSALRRGNIANGCNGWPRKIRRRVSGGRLSCVRAAQ